MDFIQLFVTTQAELEVELVAMTPLLKPTGLLWVSYPKRTSKIKTDINCDRIKTYARTMGLRGGSAISINDIWSSLRLKIA